MYTRASRRQSCIAALGSMTAAVKAQRALLALGIKSEVVALSPEDTRRGCAYGVEFPCDRASEVHRSLNAARISVSQYIERDIKP